MVIKFKPDGFFAGLLDLEHLIEFHGVSYSSLTIHQHAQDILTAVLNIHGSSQPDHATRRRGTTTVD